MSPTTRVLMVILAGLTPLPPPAHGGTRPQIDSVQLDVAGGLVSIAGHDLMLDQPPVITLGPEPLELLSFTADWVEAFLPAKLPPGTYPLSVVSDSAPGRRAAIDVTVWPQTSGGDHSDGNPYVNETGDTMTGDLVMSAGARVRGLSPPAATHDAANKGYVDGQVAGLSTQFAPLHHEHSAADITSGTLAAARLPDGGVGTTKLADGAVTSAKLAPGAVETNGLADNAVTSAKIADRSIVGADLAANLDLGGTGSFAAGLVNAGSLQLGGTLLTASAAQLNAVAESIQVDPSAGAQRPAAVLRRAARSRNQAWCTRAAVRSK